MSKLLAMSRSMGRPVGSVTRPLVRQVASNRYRGGGQAALPILMYHRVVPELDALQPEVPTAATLDTQFRALADVFNVLPLEDAAQHLYEGTLPARSVCITFDDGYADNHSIALPLLLKHRLTATVFVASGFLDGGRMFNDTIFEAVRRLPGGDVDLGWLGLGRCRVGDVVSRRALGLQLATRIKYLEPDQRDDACRRLTHMADSPLPDDLMMRSEQVVDLARHGVSIGGHTLNHPILSKVPLEVARDEIVGNHRVLTDLLGRPPACFAYPNGKPTLDYSAAHAEVVREVGYVAAVSTAVGVATLHAHRFQMPRFVPNERHGMSFVARMLRMATVRQSATAA
jgi:peptidoglycan/xylan/chitin deacetylase (PgdA/CDA1 family)